MCYDVLKKKVGIDMKNIVNTDLAPAAIGPYSQAVICNKMLYTSGQIPINPQTGEIADDIESQTKQVLSNLKAIIEESGVTMSDVVKTTVYLQDMNDFVQMNGVYASFFEEPFPARSTIQVARLPKDVKIEIEAIVDFSFL